MEKFCGLSQRIGNDEECPRAWCAFWEHYLLDLRRALDGARNEAESSITRERLAELVPPDLSGA